MIEHFYFVSALNLFDEIKFWDRLAIWLIILLNLQNILEKHVANSFQRIYSGNVSVFIFFTIYLYIPSTLLMYLPSIFQYIYLSSKFISFIWNNPNSSSSNPHTIFFTSFR